MIGTGTFGRVSVARHKASGTTVVVKSLSKAACIKDGQASAAPRSTLFAPPTQPHFPPSSWWHLCGPGALGSLAQASLTPLACQRLCARAGAAAAQVRHVLDEKAILAYVSTAGHPFLVNLRGAFQDTNCLHLVLDFVAGGDFFSFLREYPARFGSK